jgi:hypothetical protein
MRLPEHRNMLGLNILSRCRIRRYRFTEEEEKLSMPGSTVSVRRILTMAQCALR